MYTDHQPLVHFLEQTPKSAFVHRWFLELMEYKFKLVYKQGKLNGNADGMSRIPLEDRTLADGEDEPLWLRMVKTESADGVEEQLTDVTREQVYQAREEPFRRSGALQALRSRHIPIRSAKRR